MKSFFSVFASICMTILVCCSCEKDSTLYYSDLTMGNVTNGVFTSDNGNVYNVVSQECDGNLSQMKRAMVVSDILRKTSSNTYDIRLKQLYEVLVKDPIKSSSITDPSEIGFNAIGVEQAWTSAGYLNLLTTISYSKSSSTKHLINLVYDDINSTSDTLKFTLKHNGYGEAYEDGKVQDIDFASTYESFPIDDLMPAGKESIVVKINWTWYKTEGNTVYPETIQESSTGILYKK